MANSDTGETQTQQLDKLFSDFISDLKTTYPEYDTQFKSLYNDEKLNMDLILNHCQNVYPQRFFDILYKNEDIFKEDSESNTHFLPNIEFKNLWNLEGVSDNTKETIWKYLQLIVFSVIGSVEDKSVFGDCEKLFEAINEDEFKSKLESTMQDLEHIFDFATNDVSQNDTTESDTSNNFQMPNPEDIHSHISGLLDGKLGKLATEITEETVQELDIDISNMTSGNEVFEQLFKDPTKLMKIVKKVGTKLDSKMKSGEINEKELMSEATELMKQMKNMPGMGKMDDMLKNLGPLASQLGSSMGKNARFNKGAFNNLMKKEEAKERMLKTIQKRKEEREKQAKLEEERKAQRLQQSSVTQEQIEALLNEEWINEPLSKKQKPVQSKNKKKKKNKK
jgi:hypothetical protein